MDNTTEKELAKPYYDKFVELTGGDTEKYKKDLIDVYSYYGYYYSVKKDKAKSDEYWNKVLQLDPNNKYAKQALNKK
jgi:uncharacterized protein (DUF2236 family)